ncbi:hypothetical protein CDD82_2155 [Ophiocordyceps australis]|uniref:C2H2-type domain-containing protein n=1 Tax=Ophiocordyceps australis TaxID=1399860 RepID=A0A2C5Y242_9HYPO|nr:hypothetical protein CDD82_2155 [Ophiocordyceps australis]
MAKETPPMHGFNMAKETPPIHGFNMAKETPPIHDFNMAKKTPLHGFNMAKETPPMHDFNMAKKTPLHGFNMAKETPPMHDFNMAKETPIHGFNMAKETTPMHGLLTSPMELSYPQSQATQPLVPSPKPMLTVDTYMTNSMWDMFGQTASPSTALNSSIAASIFTGSNPTSTQTSPEKASPNGIEIDFPADGPLFASPCNGKPQQDFAEFAKPVDQEMLRDYSDTFPPPPQDGFFSFPMPILTPEPQPVFLLPNQAQSANPALHDTLNKIKMHIQESIIGMHHAMDDLAHQLSTMSAETVISIGLEAMATVLARRPDKCALSLICLFHLLHSLAMVLEVPSMQMRAYLHEGAQRYSNNLPGGQNKQAFITMADLFWKPKPCSQSPGLRRPFVHSAINMFHMDEPALPLETLALAVESLLDDAQERVMRDSARLLPLLPPGATEAQLRRDISSCTSWQEMAAAIESAIVGIKMCFPEATCLNQALQRTMDKVNSPAAMVLPTPHSLELELMHMGKMYLPRTTRLDVYIHEVRQQLDPVYSLSGSPVSSNDQRLQRHEHTVQLFKNMLQSAASEHDALPQNILSGWSLGPGPRTHDIVVGEGYLTPPVQTNVMVKKRRRISRSRPNRPRRAADKVEVGEKCKRCLYRPQGKPINFPGSMRKHIRTMHHDGPDIMYPCDEPGCNKVYTNRKDNLLQHKRIHHGHSQLPQRRKGQRGRCEGVGVFA